MLQNAKVAFLATQVDDGVPKPRVCFERLSMKGTTLHLEKETVNLDTQCCTKGNTGRMHSKIVEHLLSLGQFRLWLGDEPYDRPWCYTAESRPVT